MTTNDSPHPVHLDEYRARKIETESARRKGYLDGFDDGFAAAIAILEENDGHAGEDPGKKQERADRVAESFVHFTAFDLPEWAEQELDRSIKPPVFVVDILGPIGPIGPIDSSEEDADDEDGAGGIDDIHCKRTTDML